MIKRRRILCIKYLCHAISLRRLGVKAAVIEKVRKNIIVTKRSDVFTLVVDDGNSNVSVESHLLKRLTYRLIGGYVFNQALGYNKSHYIHFSPHRIPIIAAPMAVANLERSGITKLSPRPTSR